QTTIDIIDKLQWRTFHPSRVLDYFVEHVDRDNHLVGAFLCTQLAQERRVGDGLGSDNHPEDSRVSKPFYHVDAPDTPAVLDLHVDFLYDIEEVFLIGEVALGSVEVNDVNDLGAIGLVLLDHFLQTNIIRSYILVIAFA